MMASGDAQGAEAVFRRDLEFYPHNGWSMFDDAILRAQEKMSKQMRCRCISKKLGSLLISN